MRRKQDNIAQDSRLRLTISAGLAGRETYATLSDTRETGSAERNSRSPGELAANGSRLHVGAADMTP